jgi:FdhD protein
VVSVSAPSSLAIDLAARAGVTLVGFARANHFNVYANPWRLDGSPSDAPAAPGPAPREGASDS